MLVTDQVSILALFLTAAELGLRMPFQRFRQQGFLIIEKTVITQNESRVVDPVLSIVI